MKKIIAIVIWLYCYIVVLASSVSAFEFIKNSNNPLNINYLNDYYYPFQAHIYKENNRCKGILTAKRPTETYYSLVAIESEDCISWTMTKEILNISQDISNPRLFINSDGSKKLFFTKTDGKDFFRIYSADCDNNLNCSSAINLILNPNQSDLTEKNGYFASYVIKIDSRYHMFYGVWGQDGFKIRLAYSDDLQTWQKCPNNLISDGSDGPFPYLENNNLYLFFHKSDSSGIKLAKTSLPLSCNSIFEDMGYQLSPNQSYDSKHMIFLSVIEEDAGLKLYYSGANLSWNWSLNVACTKQACLLPTVTPTPTAIPTPTLAPTETPTPTKTPIVLIPGFMASWNKNAILHNQNVSQQEWKLASYVKEYKGLLETLKNLGYEENKNLFIFAYDWRKSVLEIVEDLNSFVTSNPSISLRTSKFSIIGHSLGGLVGRIFTQKNKSRLDRIITVGSPHQGVVQVYKPLEAGKIDKDNTFLWLAEKLILVLNKSTVESDKETIKKRFPVAFDLLPTFNFLKDESKKEISIENLSLKNELLTIYNQNLDEIFDIFTAIYGEKDKNTLAGHIIEPQNKLDQILGNYQDGKPKESFFDLGDYTVLTNSARQDTDAEKLNLDHGEIITNKESIKKILGLLNINFKDGQVEEGEKTNIAHSLIFLIKSPVTMTVEYNNEVYSEDEGIIFISEAQSGNYKLNVQGTDMGKYEVMIGQISENNDVWEKINGEITQLPASSQIDSYSINYDNQTAYSIFPTPTIIPTVTPTVTPTLTPTIAPTQTTTLSSNSPFLSNNKPAETPISSLTPSTAEVLGISSKKEVSVTPIPKTTIITKEKKVNKKNFIWDYIWSSVASFIIVCIGLFVRKKNTS